ncbi:MAG: L,D-transpeptidase [Bdellovibrionota bacterium]
MSNISLLKLTIYGLTVTLLGLGTSACSNSKWREVEANPNTGNAFAERQRQPPPQEEFKKDQTVFTGSDRLNGTPAELPEIEVEVNGDESADRPADRPVVVLEKNEPVKIIDPVPGPDGLIEVVRIDTRNPELPQEPIRVNKDYLSEKPVPDNSSADRYFMIQNIATEKVRVYERCRKSDANVSCPHRLVLETDMSAGEDSPTKSRRTILGSFIISAWFKFYEDAGNLFPSFYRAYYPALPDEGAGIDQWLSKSLIPDHRGKTRGSFGWYTAHLEPNADAQWTHGTFGWGADGGRFIQLVRDEKINELMDPRSMGCTRVENQAIAWMREKLPVGTKVIKVYARESLADTERTRYRDLKLAKWDWILTTLQPNESGAMSADARRVDASGAGLRDVLERGTYVLDQVPNVVRLTGEKGGATSSNGNLYDIPSSSFKGVFLIDEGRLSGYAHPKELKVGGHPKELKAGGHADYGLPRILVK